MEKGEWGTHPWGYQAGSIGGRWRDLFFTFGRGLAHFGPQTGHIEVEVGALGLLLGPAWGPQGTLRIELEG